MENQKLFLAIPKGSLQEYTLKIFKQAGFEIKVPERGYILEIDDPDITCYLLRPQEIPLYLAKNKLDLGISGDEWIKNLEARMIEVLDLKYAKTGLQKKVKWVLAVPQNSPIKSVKDLNGKTVSTEATNLAKQYFAKHGVKVKLEFSWGATEGKPPRFVDAIIDITETGSSIKANNLKIIDIVFESSTKLIASPLAWKNPWKREKINTIALLLDSAVKGDITVNVFFHINRKIFKQVRRIVPSLKEPTVRELTHKGWLDIALSCNKLTARKLIPQLKRMGAEAIVEFPTEKLMP